MKNRSAWLRFWAAWAIPAVVVVANAVWLGGVRGAVLGRGSLLARQVREAEGQVERLERQAVTLEEAKTASDALRQQLVTVREQRLGSMSTRLVPFLVDVVRRASDAGLASERISYQVKPDEQSGLVYFSATYELEGSYEQIRTYIGLLETSPQFVVIERLELRGVEDASALTVTVRLGVGTYFYDLDRALLARLGVKEVPHGQ
jgi:Tfp pilus assembly protein PilO